MEILYSIKATILQSGTGRELKRKTGATNLRRWERHQNGPHHMGGLIQQAFPYLYLGSEPGTAAAEVRPHPGEIVCVAEFQTESELQLVDLRSPRSLISPFLLSDEMALAQLRSGDIKFLESLGQGLGSTGHSNCGGHRTTLQVNICASLLKSAATKELFITVLLAKE